MQTFKEYLAEAEKNVHMEHAEDLVFNDGVNGARRAINFLRDLRDMLAGNSATSTDVSVKFDGSPAVFVGIDPRDGKFFVAKKGIFNKEPKVYKTKADVDADTEGDLNVKMHLALTEFSKLGIKSGVYQGDLMFSHDTLKKQTISGEDYITFHPNTIVYAVPAGTPEAASVMTAKIGVVWHTTYTGDSFENMKATFGKPIVDKFKQVPSVWQVDAVYHDYSGTATFTKSETDKVTSLLSTAGKVFNSINGRALDYIANSAEFLVLLKTYNNSKVRAGEEIVDTSGHVDGLIAWIQDRFKKDADSKKTPKGKEASALKLDKALEFFKIYSKGELIKMFDLSNLLVEAKHLIVAKMNRAGKISTFLKTKDGFKLTDPEGYVAIDNLSGGAVKIINRMIFSKSNFDPEIQKGWQR